MPDTYGWIWPKDPRPGNPKHWPRRWRLFDILTNRGPDIFVGRIRSGAKNRSADIDGRMKVNKRGVVAIGSQTASRCESTETQPTCWSRWEYDCTDDDDSHIHPALRNKTKPKPKKERTESKSPFPWARRDSAERYDFRTKRYCIPDSGTWSRVQYCSGVSGGGLWREKHVVPMRYWDRNGHAYPAGYWHDIMYGRHSGCDRAGIWQSFLP